MTDIILKTELLNIGLLEGNRIEINEAGKIYEFPLRREDSRGNQYMFIAGYIAESGIEEGSDIEGDGTGEFSCDIKARLFEGGDLFISNGDTNINSNFVKKNSTPIYSFAIDLKSLEVGKSLYLSFIF